MHVYVYAIVILYMMIDFVHVCRLYTQQRGCTTCLQWGSVKLLSPICMLRRGHLECCLCSQPVSICLSLVYTDELKLLLKRITYMSFNILNHFCLPHWAPCTVFLIFTDTGRVWQCGGSIPFMLQKLINTFIRTSPRVWR